MAHLSVRLPDSLIEDLNAIAQAQHQNKAEIVREALEYYRKYKIQEARQEQLIRASILVRSDSIRINHEFSAIEGDPA
jgi:metal-responsive CopG/Arc/MetJ family transcriptional regulator